MRAEPLPESLCHEGGMMRDMLIDGLTRAGGHHLTTTHDSRLPAPDCPSQDIHPAEDVWAAWGRKLAGSDYCWLIAPESAGLLHRLTTLASTRGVHIMGSQPQAVALCASKWALGRHLRAAGIATPHSTRLGSFQPAWPTNGSGWILKPDCGTGCTGNYHVRTPEQFATCSTLYTDGGYIVQQYIRGTAASLSVLIHRRQTTVLACNQQHLSTDPDSGRMRLHALGINALADLREKLQTLARRVAHAIPGLAGFVGIDLVLHDEHPVVIEINPRLTSAAVGLEDSIGTSTVRLLLDLFVHGRLPEMPQLDNRSIYLELGGHG